MYCALVRSRKQAGMSTTQPPAQERPLGPGVVRVGIVHSWPLVRLGLRTALESTGRWAVVAEAGKGAVLAQAFPEDLGVQVVLVEVRSPFRELRQCIRWLKHERRIPVLAYGELTERVADELADLDVHGLLPADVEEDELHRAATVASAGGYHANSWFKRRLAKRGGKRKASGSSDPSPRQLEFLQHLSHPAGYTLQRIAEQMDVGIRTVEAHRDALFLKFNVRKCPALVAIAKDRRWV